MNSLRLRWPDAVWHWGTTPDECASGFPCDALVGRTGAQAVYRAISVEAPAAVVFRWLCQLRVAPYSYDLIDNLGRRSPRSLTPGLGELAAGQRILQIYRIASFEPGESITMVNQPGPLGRSAATYRVTETGPGRSRIVVKLMVDPPAGTLRGALLRFLFPPGDLVMVRRQLLNLRRLAEASSVQLAVPGT